ncbi:MAG: RDD family protein [Chloroflexaceae bacterium]|nr:RDD family protein [Chloroflexaceae bacterium]
MPNPVLHNSKYGYYAGFVSRVIATFIDALIVTTSITLSVVGFSYIVRFISVVTFFDPIEWYRYSVEFTIPPILIGLIPPITFALYEIILIAAVGRTIGKAIVGLEVVNRRGEHPSIYRAFLRVPGKYLAAAPLLLGYFWILADDERQGWHDKIAQTWVVYAWANARPDEDFLMPRAAAPVPPQLPGE